MSRGRALVALALVQLSAFVGAGLVFATASSRQMVLVRLSSPRRLATCLHQRLRT